MNLYAERSIYNAPDPVKMEKAIASIQMAKPELLVILFAYYAGLGGAEMLQVKVSDISEDFSFLIAPDKRKIPLVSRLADELKSLPWIYKSPDTPVLLSVRYGRAISRVHTNNVVKKFMEFAGMPHVHLSDLRVACVVNWMQQYPWEYVSQISGLEVRVLTQRYQYYLPETSVRHKVAPVEHTSIRPDIINSILQSHKADLFGLIFRLNVVHQLTHPIICGLTWDMIDNETSMIRLPEQNIPISDDLRSCLNVAREYSDTKWVLAYPNSKTPYTSDSISHLMNQTLIADGYPGLTVKTLIRAAEYLRFKEIVNTLLMKEKSFFVEDFLGTSGLTAERARSILSEMEREGFINRIGIRFYSAETTVSPTRFLDVVQELTQLNGGSFMSGQFAEAIGIDVRSATTQLRRMIAEGQVERVSGQKYACKLKTNHK